MIVTRFISGLYNLCQDKQDKRRQDKQDKRPCIAR